MRQPGELASFYFHQGTSTHAYEYLGCNLTREGDDYVYTFRTWAPNARAVFLISDFTGWDAGLPMTRVTERGVYECTYISDVSLERAAYKFRVVSKKKTTDKGDPYARFSRGGSDGSSLIFCEPTYRFSDREWFAHRAKAVGQGKDYLASPLNIYEVHFGSFACHEDGSFLTYSEMADQLIPYVKAMGYTHIEFLPLAEFPFDPSWGYQVCAFYAPTSRFGDPDGLRELVDRAHRAGIGVIMDWVPAHFPKDAWGLYEFDGSPLYEYQGRDRQESPSWGTRFFDLGREEVQSFLISNALYFLREFHLDGLRVDAVASMIYLDYDRKPGEWFPNPDGSNENREGTAFLRKLNASVLSEFPDALMIAEESTAFPGVTHPVSDNGLGFSLKWNMGFANDLYDYVAMDPVYRRYHHSALNFPLMYAWSENFVLPVSHDEVVHGKKSFLDKMFGSYEDKFSQARTALLMYMTYPGKKLFFMGTEYGPFREWDFASSLEWFMLDYPKHKALSDYTAALNRFYLASPELWENDLSPDGFTWIDADLAEQNAVVFERHDRSGNALTVLLSFSGAEQTVTLTYDKAGWLIPQFCTLETGNPPPIRLKKNGKKYVASVTLPAFSGVIFRKQQAKKRIKLPKYNEDQNN